MIVAAVVGVSLLLLVLAYASLRLRHKRVKQLIKEQSQVATTHFIDDGSDPIATALMASNTHVFRSREIIDYAEFRLNGELVGITRRTKECHDPTLLK